MANILEPDKEQTAAGKTDSDKPLQKSYRGRGSGGRGSRKRRLERRKQGEEETNALVKSGQDDHFIEKSDLIPAAGEGKDAAETKKDVGNGRQKQKQVAVTFLGTCSGSGPIISRNCSSLAVNLDGALWVFDCAEGTQMKFHEGHMKMAKVSRIFITHVHADHTLGLVPLLATLMTGVTTTPEEMEALRKEGTSKKAKLHIYGPPGLRQLIRVTLKLTSCNLSGTYAIHELIPTDGEPSCGCSADELHTNEAPGADIPCDSDGVWRNIRRAEESHKDGKGKSRGNSWEDEWEVDAGPLEHRVMSLGYILREPQAYENLDVRTLIPLLEKNREALAASTPPVKNPRSILSILSKSRQPYSLPDGTVLQPPKQSDTRPRKLVILGDCSRTTSEVFNELCSDASLLVHECTNAHIDAELEKGEKGKAVKEEELDHSLLDQVNAKLAAHKQAQQSSETHDGSEKEKSARDKVEEKAKKRGHSTAQMAGSFAKDLGVKRLAVNHFSVMFPSSRFADTGPFPGVFAPSFHPAPGRPPAAIPNNELFRRIILSNIESQITAAWAGVKDLNNFQATEIPSFRAVAARDLMTISVPSHELVEEELNMFRKANQEAIEAEAAWRSGGQEELIRKLAPRAVRGERKEARADRNQKTPHGSKGIPENSHRRAVGRSRPKPRKLRNGNETQKRVENSQ